MKDLLKKDPKASYQFNLTKLETTANKALEAWKLNREDEKTRTVLFTTIRELTYAILCVGDYESKYSIKADDIAYEYSLYLFERLILGTFDPVYGQDGMPNRFPFQKYISINLRHVIITKNKDRNWHELLVDLEFLMNVENTGMMEFDEKEETLDFRLDKQGLAKRIYKGLRVYYPEAEIRRLLPMAMVCLDLEPKDFLAETQPKDLRDFITILISISKRLLSKYNVNVLPYDYQMKEFSKIVSSSVRSTVFLSAVVNSEFFPKELLLSLDLDSLYRLVSIAGGQTIRIPTKKELDAVIGSVVTVSKVIMENKSIDQSLAETKNDLELMFPTRIRGTNIQTYISKILEVHNVFGEEQNSDPIIHSLVSAIKSMDTMIAKMVKDIDKTSPEQLIQVYKEITTTFKILTDGLTKIGKMAVGSTVNKLAEDTQPPKEI